MHRHCTHRVMSQSYQVMKTLCFNFASVAELSVVLLELQKAVL